MKLNELINLWFIIKFLVYITIFNITIFNFYLKNKIRILAFNPTLKIKTYKNKYNKEDKII